MSNDACVLTRKDFTLLELMLDRCLGLDDPLRPLLTRKLDAARVMPSEDVPEDVATLNSRVGYCVNGGTEQSRLLTRDRLSGPVGLALPITTQRGLALLGLTVGQSLLLPTGGNDGRKQDRLTLRDVLYQPEAARRHLKDNAIRPTQGGRPALRLIQGGAAVCSATPDQPDDPGPFAA